MTAPQLHIHDDSEALARAVAHRLLTTLRSAQSEAGGASLVLTGGGMGRASLEAVRDSPERDHLDWTAVDIWWGDERYLPAGDPERNETLARTALLDHVPVPASRVHVMPADDDTTTRGDPGAAAALYREMLRTHGEGTESPRFDVLLLGVGPDGHVASLFPDHPGLEDARTAFAVHDSPKPPPTRISLGFSAITRARQVWCVVSGSDKAEAVAAALEEAGSVSGAPEVPAARARGTEATHWFVDRASAAALGS